jgi:Transposase DDE domain group 1
MATQPNDGWRRLHPAERSRAKGRLGRVVSGGKPFKHRGNLGSSVSPTHGEQEMSVWNGHFTCTCYHPLFLFNHFDDLERCALRPGNVHSAEGWESVLGPVVAAISRQGVAPLLPRRCRLRHAGDLRVPGSRGHQVRDPASGQLGPPGGDWPSAQAAGGAPPHHVRRFHTSFHYQAASWTNISRAGSSPRSSGIRANFIRASASS